MTLFKQNKKSREEML